MIVVSDTSPLHYLQRIDRLELLEQIFEAVLIPSAVYREWQRGFSDLSASTYAWLHVAEPRDRAAVRSLRMVLDEGEAEAIALAVERHAELLLIDEEDGRAAAVERGLKIMGVLGVLVRAKGLGLLPSVRPEIDRLLSETNFYCKPSLLNQVLALAGETPNP